ncbi:Uu.00g028450.m01.CDS01 [Anthostomella pinea]|uniref:Dynein light chain n=1 Tax=Anthostomella pinea TaxID=933095 RepID=A0AAI8V8H8_9PEZI|nr:Uu.00g028450.m01.CDS01 [Anthostomella pinea]
MSPMLPLQFFQLELPSLTIFPAHRLTESQSPQPTSVFTALAIVMSEKNSPPPAASHEKLEAQIKSADMTEDMQQETIDVAQEAMGKFTIEKDIAQHIKKTFDERKGPTWHCIVGRNFGSFVTHETKHFIYFYLGHCAILLFKTQ